YVSSNVHCGLCGCLNVLGRSLARFYDRERRDVADFLDALGCGDFRRLTAAVRAIASEIAQCFFDTALGIGDLFRALGFCPRLVASPLLGAEPGNERIRQLPFVRSHCVPPFRKSLLPMHQCADGADTSICRGADASMRRYT